MVLSGIWSSIPGDASGCPLYGFNSETWNTGCILEVIGKSSL